MDWPRPEFQANVFGKANLLLCLGRQGLAVNDDMWSLALCSNMPVDQNLYRRGGVNAFPLHVFEGRGRKGLFHVQGSLSSNLRASFIKTLGDTLNLKCSAGKHDGLPGNTLPESYFHFAYAVLFSPGYRCRYAEFLKTDFPRLPSTSSLQLFQALAERGRQLVALHIMDSPALDNHITTFLGSGELKVEKVSYSDESVWINKAKTRGFQGVPEEVWTFHIGGYQVCEKWLKDRQAKGGKKPRSGRVLTDEDIDHYQKIVVALNETIRIMAEIDEVIEEHGGWPDAFAGSTETRKEQNSLPFQ